MLEHTEDEQGQEQPREDAYDRPKHQKAHRNHGGPSSRATTGCRVFKTNRISRDGHGVMLLTLKALDPARGA